MKNSRWYCAVRQVAIPAWKYICLHKTTLIMSFKSAMLIKKFGMYDKKIIDNFNKKK